MKFLVRLHGHHQCETPFEPILNEPLEERIVFINTAKARYETAEQIACRLRSIGDYDLDVPDDLAAAYVKYQRAHTEWQRVYTEWLRADAQWLRADVEWQRAYTECQRAHTEWQRADAERRRANEQWQRADAEWHRATKELHRAETEWNSISELHLPLLVKLHDELCVQRLAAQGFECKWTPEHRSIF